MLKGMPFLFIDDNEGIFMVEVEEIKSIPAQMPGKWVTVRSWLTSLLTLIKKGSKRPLADLFASYQQEKSAPRIGSYHIILDGQNVPVCVIRLISMQLVRFCDVTEAFARKRR